MTFRTPPSRSNFPSTATKVENFTTSEYSSTSLLETITLMNPNSSSISRNTVPFALCGCWRMVTSPAVVIHSPPLSCSSCRESSTPFLRSFSRRSEWQAITHCAHRDPCGAAAIRLPGAEGAGACEMQRIDPLQLCPLHHVVDRCEAIPSSRHLQRIERF